LKLLTISIQGFRSFKRDEVFEFPSTDAGLFLISGDNQVDPELGANACGKSTLWEALVWALYGKTSRGLRASAIANWHREQLCSVSVEMEVNGELYAILRTWDPNTLVCERFTKDDKQEPQVITQDQLEDLIGVDYTTFMNTVLMGQFNQFFFDLTASEKLTIFSQALNLQSWLDAADRARDRVRDCKVEIQEHEKVEAAQQEGLTTIKHWAIHFKEKTASFELSRSKNIKSIRKAARLLRGDVERLQIEIDKHVIREKVYKKRITDSVVKVTELKQKLSVAKKLLDRLSKESMAQLLLLDDLNVRVKKLQAIDAECPLCDQTVSASHLSEVVIDFKNKAVAAQATYDALSLDETRAEKLFLKVDEKLVEQETVGAEAQIDLAKRSEKILSATTHLSKLKSDRESLGEDLVRAEQEENPYTENLEQCESDVISRETKLHEVRRKLVARKKERERASYWQKEFKNVRLWLIERALAELEIHVNSSLVELGLTDWAVTFDVEKPKSDGKSFTKGFTVFITPPGFDEPVPWESWSGGETQRLRIAGAIGLSTLISSRRGFDPSIEIWDEPTAHLSREGIEDLLKFLGARSRRERRQLFLVDHRSLNAGDFDDEYMIVKNASGSHIVQPTRKGQSITANTPVS